MKNNISILGVGNLTQSLLASLHSNNFKGKIYLYDIDKSKKKNAKATNVVFIENLNDFLKKSKILIIAVKPINYKKVFDNIREQISSDTVIISLMAGIKIKEISNECNGHKIIIRAMTNLNAKYSNAISFFYFDKKIRLEHKKLAITTKKVTKKRLNDRSSDSWINLRELKKLKLQIKDKISQLKH